MMTLNAAWHYQPGIPRYLHLTRNQHNVPLVRSLQGTPRTKPLNEHAACPVTPKPLFPLRYQDNGLLPLFLPRAYSDFRKSNAYCARALQHGRLSFQLLWTGSRRLQKNR